MKNNTSMMSNVLTLILGTGGAQIVALLALPLLTRLYTPEDFGLFSVYSAIVSIGTIVICLRYELAITLPKTDRAGFLVYQLCRYSAFLTSFIFAVIFWFSSDMLAEMYEVSQGTLWLWFIPVSLLVGGLYKASIFWHTRKKDYKRLATAKISQSLPQTFFQLVFGLSPLGAGGLVIGEVIGKACGAISLEKKHLSAADTVRPSVTKIKTMAGIYKDFPLVSSGSAVVNQLGIVAPSMFIATYFGIEVAGLYAMSQRLLAVPMDLIGQSIMSLYIGEVSELKRKNPKGMASLYTKFISRMFLAGSGIVFMVLVFGDWVFVKVFGSEWLGASDYAKVMVFAFWFRFAVSPLSQTLNIIGRQDIQIKWDVTRLFLVVLGFSVAILLGLEPLEAMIIYTGVIIFSQCLHALITLLQLRRI